MSVINQMLKDLDGRKKEKRSLASTDFQAGDYVSGQNISLVKMISLIVFIVFLVVLITTVTIYQFDLFNNNQDTTIESPLPVKKKAVKKEPVNKEPVSQEPTNKEPVNKDKLDVESTETTVIEQVNAQPQNSMPIQNQITDKAVVIEESELTEKSISSEQKVIKSTAKITPIAQSEKLFKQAQLNVDRGAVLKAKQQLSEAIDLNPKNHKARVLLLTVLLSGGESAAMQQLLDSILNQWPKVNEYRQLQARLYLASNDQLQALSILQQDIPLIETSVDYHALLAFVAQQLKQDDLASKHFRLLLQVNNSRADWWLGFAVSEERLGNNDIALQAYNQSISRTGLSETVKNYARQRIQVIQGN
ncbi:MAG: Flp pilus assembly protein TadD [Enterobacterales bacterium]